MILAVDLGRRKTGLAISEGSLASPYKTISHKSQKEAIVKVVAEIEKLAADTVVLGYTEGKNKIFFERFKNELEIKKPKLKISFQAEDLTTRQARDTMIKLQVPQKKKSEKEHAVAASIILEEYLENI